MTVIDLPLIRNSERSDFKTCPAKWNWRWHMGLIPATPKQDALWFGTIWHLLWATVYTPPEGADGFTRSITNPVEIHDLWDELAKDSYTTISCAPFFDEDKEKEYWDAITLGHVMIDGQLRTWNLDPHFEVLMPEQRYSAKIAFNSRQKGLPLQHWTDLGYPRGAASGGYIVKAVGTFDLPVRDHSDGRGRVWIVDWKSTNRKENLKQANKDDQLGMYIAVSTGFLRAAELIPATEEVAGGMWSFAKKSMPPPSDKVDPEGRVRNLPTIKHFKEALLEFGFVDEDFKGLKKDDLERLATDAKLKVWGEVSKNQGGALFWREPVVRNKANRLRQIARIADDSEAIAAVRAGLMPVTKNPDAHCNWCPFTDLCDIDEDGGDTQDYINNVFKYEDPYADHRAGAQNSKESVRG